ncbi:MAG: ABC transporter permease [Firmicutes bacterium]|nr:ABC transporter permease [Bacillota bacterium]
MILALLRKELHEMRWKLLLGTGILTALAVTLPFLYEFILDMMQAFLSAGDFLSRFLPAEQLKLLENYSFYIWSQWNAKNLYQIGLIFAILTGMSLIAGETGSQTAHFLLTRPVSRRMIYFSKASAGALVLLLMVLISTAAIFLVTRFTPYSLEAGRLWLATAITVLCLLSVYSLTLYCSTVIDDPVRAGGAALLVILASSVLGWFPATRDFSLLAYIQGAQYFLQGAVPVLPLAVITMSGLLLLLAGALVFERKNF